MNRRSCGAVHALRSVSAATPWVREGSVIGTGAGTEAGVRTGAGPWAGADVCTGAGICAEAGAPATEAGLDARMGGAGARVGETWSVPAPGPGAGAGAGEVVEADGLGTGVAIGGASTAGESGVTTGMLDGVGCSTAGAGRDARDSARASPCGGRAWRRTGWCERRLIGRWRRRRSAAGRSESLGSSRDSVREDCPVRR